MTIFNFARIVFEDFRFDPNVRANIPGANRMEGNYKRSGDSEKSTLYAERSRTNAPFLILSILVDVE